MKHSNAILAAAGALAQLAIAQPHLVERDPVYVTVMDYKTDYTTVTAGSSAATAHVHHVKKENPYWKKHGHHHYSSSAQSTTLATSTVAASSTESTSQSESATSTQAATTTTQASSSSQAASSSSSSAVSSASSTATTSTDASGGNPYTTNGIKVGLSGYVGITSVQAFTDLSDYIGWYSDYTATTADVGSVEGIPMLWGNGESCPSLADDASRLATYKSAVSSTTPKIMFGFYEPDCDCPMSSNMQDPSTGTSAWNELIAPLAAQGTTLGSPSMCKQKDETWLTPFMDGLDADWNITSIHINKNTLAGAQEDVEYYAAKYGKPIWVSEFACVDDTDGFTPCTDQDEIDTFINEVVPFFQNNASVIAFGASNGEGLGTVWPLIDSTTGGLSATGTTYLNAIKALSS